MAIKAQSSNQVTKITVKQSRQNLPIELGQSAQHFNNLAELWATSPNIVENKDYSSKYYAEKSKESEAKAENYERSIVEKCNSFVEVSNQAEVELQTLKDESISQINIATSSGISDIANKTSEVVTEINSNKETATNEINNVKNSAVTQLSKEAQQQLKNIESTGFYMRDDKLYFINSEGEDKEFKSGSSFNLFDTKISDHILQGEEAKGWALQGTYVGGAVYPDFYNKCLEEYQNGEAQISTEPWTQPVATGEITTTDGGDMVITSSEGVEESYYPYLAFDGNYSSSSSMWSAYPNTEAWWQIKFPYKIKVTGLTFYQKYSGSTHYTKDACFYTSSDMNTSIGDAFVATGSSFAATEIQNIPAEGIITDTIYLNITSSHNGGVGMGDLKITAEKVIDEIRNNPNGHKFYPISLKPQIDEMYNQYGIADFYGIDEENQRVFLPRNKYFALTGGVMGNGKVLGLNRNAISNTNSFSQLGSKASGNSDYVDVIATNEDIKAGYPIGVNTDPTKSGIVLEANESKYLYYCVGNTEVTQAITNVTEVTTSENDTIPLFTGMYFDFKPNNVSWLKAGQQQNNAGIYKTCYDTLVEIVNGINNYDLKVINKADMVSGVIYDEHWILDQDNMTFRTPIRTSERILVAKKEATDEDSTWYNLYSDGWLEQGGISYKYGTTTLLKPYKDTTYLIVHNYTTEQTSGGGTVVYVDETKTTTQSFYIGYNGGWSSLHWQTSGYAQIPTLEEYTEPLKLYFKVANAVQNLELLDVGRVMEEAVLRSTLAEAQVVVETYQNGTSWCRVWSDGWCEQGGIVAPNVGTSGTITLLKEYANTNYTVVSNTGNNAANNFFNLGAYQKTTTSIPWWKSAAGIQGDWEAKGYIK